MTGSNLIRRSAWAIAAFVLFACEDGGAPVDAGSDAGDMPDSAVPRTCEAPPPPSVAPTTTTQALADSPARCGQAPHTWLRSTELGDVVGVSDQEVLRANLLGALAAGLGLELPEPPRLNVGIRTVTYMTQDRGALIEATAGVAYPLDVSEAPLEVLLFTHGTSGFTDGCGASNNTSLRTLAAVFASWGYLVVSPDYLGLKNGGDPTGFPHPYLVGQATAIASLDAVRAALRMDPADVGGNCVGSRYVSFGGSQGGHAVLFIDRLAPYYAAELTPLGGIAMVPPSDLLGQAELGLTSLAGVSDLLAGMLATAPLWYGAGDRLDEVFVAPYDVDVPALLAASCAPEPPDISMLDELYAGPLLAAVAAGTLADYAPFGCILEENGITTTSIERLAGEADSYGILFVTGEEDALGDRPTQRVAFEALCDAGMPMRYLECAGASHGTAQSWALPELVRFMRARFAEQTFAPDCTVSAAVTCEGTPAP